MNDFFLHKNTFQQKIVKDVNKDLFCVTNDKGLSNKCIQEKTVNEYYIRIC